MSQNYLARFLKEYNSVSWREVSFLAICSGIANGILLCLINNGAAAASQSSTRLQFLFLYIIAMIVFCYAKKKSMTRSIRIIENMLHDLRVRVVNKLRRTSLRQMESFSKGDIYTKISQDTVTISQSAFFLVNIVQALVMVVCCLLYIAWLSPGAFFMTVFGIIIATSIYWGHRQKLVRDMAEMNKKEGEIVEAVSDIVEGYKELYGNQKRNEGVFKHYSGLAEESRTVKVRANDTFILEIMFTQIFFYLLIGAVVFILPEVVPTYSVVVIRVTAAILFIVNPLDIIATTAPLITRANSALKNIYDLDDVLTAPQTDADRPFQTPSQFLNFQEITGHSLQFTYRDAENNPLFTVGPFDMHIRRGETVFFVGGNGCGKTTLMKIICGLYQLNSGELRLDGQRLEQNNYQDYRELFSVIFSDFHLFDRLYGQDEVDPTTVNNWLKKMDIAHKTQFIKGRFTHTDLSTGQRKRLALIVALLDDRPIVMLDEWAADQDPQFRTFFYETLLAEFRAAGKTVLAVSHDDRFWHLADRVVKMEYGQLARNLYGASTSQNETCQ